MNALIAVLFVFAASSGTAGAARASGWSIQSSVDLAGPPQGGLSSVSCTSTSACTGVGYYVDTSGTNRTLAERWDGRAWTIQPTPNPTGATSSVLSGVSCVSATLCTAVGRYVGSAGTNTGLVEVWSNGSWAIQPTATPSGATQSALSGVSCTAASACTAVGSYTASSGTQQTLAEAWNGSTWLVQPTPNPSGGGSLGRVSCTGVTACTALGSGTLVERWDGTAWAIQPIPVPTGATSTSLYGLDCSAAALCTAVGHWTQHRCNNGQPTCNCFRFPYCTYKQGALAERWNGSSWTIQTTPGGGTLRDVSCSAADSCTAVGDAGFAERWNGTAWTTQATAGAFDLSAVDCPGAAACEAVGSGGGGTLAEQWSGSGWALQATTTPVGPPNTALSGVSCATASTCTAVGSYVTPSGARATLAESWNGSNWTAQPTPNPAGPMTSSLSGVSCFAANACTAVGAYYDSTVGGNPPPDLALVEGWNGSGWTIQPTPSVGQGFNSALSGVACAATTTCTAVGYDYYNQGPYNAPLIEQSITSGWVIQSAPSAAGANTSQLASVSCSTTTACVAVGSSGIGDPLAEQWNGTSWAITSPGGMNLQSVSCAAANKCFAVGGQGTPSAEEWDGMAWTVLAVPLPTDNNGGDLRGVSCTAATDCTAVGSYNKSTGPELALVEHWDGAAWTIEDSPNPPGAVLTRFTGVSCTAASMCTAVGYYQNGLNLDQTLVERYQ